MWSSSNLKGTVTCINLYEREDRYEHIQSFASRYDIPIKFHRVHKHPISGLQGCFESHIEVIKESYNRGDEYCIIFEDDIEATEYLTVDNLNKVHDFISSNPDWDLFYLGYLPYYINTKVKRYNKDIIQLRAVTTHAYIISRRFMKLIKDFEPRDIHYDIFLCNSTSKCYALRYPLFNQGDYDTDNISVNYCNLGRKLLRWFLTVYMDYINLSVIDWFIIILPIFFTLIIIITWVFPYRFTYLGILMIIISMMIILLG